MVIDEMLTVYMYTIHRVLVVVCTHDNVPIAVVGLDGCLDFDAAVTRRGSVEPVLPLARWSVARFSCVRYMSASASCLD